MRLKKPITITLDATHHVRVDNIDFQKYALHLSATFIELKAEKTIRISADEWLAWKLRNPTKQIPDFIKARLMEHFKREEAFQNIVNAIKAMT